MGNRIDNWREEDFVEPVPEGHTEVDPWDLPHRRPAKKHQGASSIRHASVPDTADTTMSKISLGSSTRVAASVESSLRSDSSSMQSLSGKNSTRKDQNLGNKHLYSNIPRQFEDNKDPWGFEIPSNHPLPVTSDTKIVDEESILEDNDLDLNIENLDEIRNSNRLYINHIIDESQEEPEVTAEYEDESHEELYGVEITNSNINRKLDINRWLNSLGELDDDTVDYITEILMRFSIQRFTRWIDWLRKQEWDELILVKFFEFREYYASYMDYWQYMWWSSTEKSWHLGENYYSLNLVDTLKLVESRIHFPANLMIEEDWIEDWHNLNVSHLYLNNCLRLSQFALYRSRLVCGEDWKRRNDLGFDFESDFMLITRDGGTRYCAPNKASSYDLSEAEPEPTSSFDSDRWTAQLARDNEIVPYNW